MRGTRTLLRQRSSRSSTVIENGNVFAELMKTLRVCSLGQITMALFEVGGEFRYSPLLPLEPGETPQATRRVLVC